MKTTPTYLLFLIFLFVSCTKQEIIDTGTSKAKFEGSMYAYLKQDPYNWKLTTEMIERAELTSLFEGKVDSLKEITFFGPTSYSILRYLYDNGLDEVSELTPEFCRTSILKYIVKGKHLKENFPFRNMQYLINDTKQPESGYTKIITLGNNELRAYREKTEYSGIPEAGPIIMYLYSITQGMFVPLASPNIQPANGVVHSLNYNFKFNAL